ncbi:SusC/RagA family TonB-linked outer membrane protein [Bacteroidia bacterium]|nr:SusC/RagA family TonB-linked outer membrane protein [Bacteroidia bacterium]
MSIWIASATSYSQTAMLNLEVKNGTILDVINEIEKQSEFTFVYNVKDINLSERVSVAYDNKSINEVLEDLFRNNSLGYQVTDRHIALFSKKAAQQQTSERITGTIVDDRNEPIIGANVVLKGTTNGTVSDFNGKFELTVPVNGTLLISYIGYLEQEIKIAPGKTNYVVELREDSKMLDDVVVVGYGVQKKKLVTGATVQIKGDDITKLNTVNALGALASQTPGINITQLSGMPGEGFKVAVRGLGTVGSSEPLYIVDGITGGDINALNPSDIETIDILKDAASAAIYGARAANGVVLITTKQGRAGKLSVSLDSYLGWQNVYKKPDLLNAQQYVNIMNEAHSNDGKTVDWEKLVPDWNRIQNGWEGPQWFESALNKNALIQNHAFNINGGSEQSVFSFGVSYTNQDGTIGKPVAPKFERTTIRINSEHALVKRNTLEILKLGENINFNYGNRSGIAIGNMDSNTIYRFLNTYPLFDVYDANGDYTKAIPYDSRRANPIGVMEYEHGQNETKTYGLNANVYLILQPIKDLKIRSSFGTRYSANEYRRFAPTYNLSSNNFRNENEVQQRTTTRMNWMIENTVNYRFALGRNHFDLLLGQSVENNGMGSSMNGTNKNSIFNDFEHAYLDNTKVIAAGSTSLSGSPMSPHKLASFFGRVNYDFKETYMMTLVMRADGSSNFNRGNRWGYFPSVSAGWVLTNESFMQPVTPVMDFFKLRASWGQNGNQDIDNFQYLATVNYGARYYFGTDKSAETTGAYPDILPNKNVTWETSEQIDLGFDARFFSSRLQVALDYYEKNTKNWLLRAPALSSYGTGAPYINGGDVSNKGVELGLGWNDRINDFSYGVNYNLTYNKNEVTHIANAEGIIKGDESVLWRHSEEMYRAQEGYPIGYFYGYKTGGVFQTQQEIDNYQEPKYVNTRPGDLIIIDTNSDGIIDINDRTMIGNPYPKFTMGMSFNLAYKGFDMNVATVASLGNQIAQSFRSYNDEPLENYTTEIYGRWHGEGTSNKLPRLTSGSHTNWQNVSDIYIHDGDYFRIQNLSVGYDFKNLMRNMFFSQARLYVSVQNLLTITSYSGMDPEIGYGNGRGWASGIDIGFYPSPRTVLFGVNLKF